MDDGQINFYIFIGAVILAYTLGAIHVYGIVKQVLMKR